MEPDVGLTKLARQTLGKELQRLLADTYTLYLKTQNCHWNVRGKEWYPLHLLFETHYKEMADAVDEIAERIGALGHVVEASFVAFKKQTRQKELEHAKTASKLILNLLKGHEALIEVLRPVLELAEKEGDSTTADLVLRRLGAHEKMAWFLRNYLN